MHSIQIGSLVLNGQLVLYLIYGVVGWIILRYYSKQREDQKFLVSCTSNAFWLWLLIWKGSFIVFYPVDFINQPMSILYFDGGLRGIWTANLSVVLYIAYQTVKQKVKAWIWVELGVLFLLGCWVATHLLYAITGEKPLFYHISSAAFAVILLYLLTILRKTNDAKNQVSTMVWFFIGNAILLFFVADRSLLVLSFSGQQILFILGALLLTAWSWVEDKKQKRSSV